MLSYWLNFIFIYYCYLLCSVSDVAIFNNILLENQKYALQGRKEFDFEIKQPQNPQQHGKKTLLTITITIS